MTPPDTHAADELYAAVLTVLIRCDECEADLPVWPDPAYPLVPTVEHQLDDTHCFLWPHRERKGLYREGSDHAI